MMRSNTLFISTLACLLLVLHPAAARAERVPVPHDAAQKIAEAEIKSLFRDAYNQRGNEAMVLLAQTLIDRARNSDQPPTRYVLLREARDLAIKAGDVQLTFNTIDHLRESFAFDPLDMKLAAVRELARSIRDEHTASSYTLVCLEVADQALAVDRYDDLAKALAAAEPITRKASDLVAVLRLESRKANLKQLQTEFRRLTIAQKKLQEDPSDANANLMVGRFYCLIKGDWSKGLPLLARAGDSPLKGLAEQELASPSDAAAWLALAQGWSSQADLERSDLKPAMALRALHWYIKMWRQTVGLDKDRMYKQMEALAATAGQPLGIYLLDDQTRAQLLPYKKKYFLLVQQWLTWDAAQAWCLERGANLPSVSSEEEQTLLTRLVASIPDGPRSFWLGGYLSDGRWRWLDGTPFRFTRWERHQPDNWDGIETILCSYPNGWNDHAPSQHHRMFIAQWSPK